MENHPETARGRLRLPSIRRDFGLQLLTVYLLFVLPVAAAGLGFDAYSSARLRADVEAADLALARAIALETDSRVADAILAVRQLGSVPGVIAADPGRMERLFADVAASRPDINLTYRLGPDGIMLFHYPTGPGSTVGTDFSFRPYFVQARDLLEPVVSDGRISPTTNQPVATTVMPLVDEGGRFLGVIATNIALQSLSQTLAAIAEEQEPAEGFRVSIIDASGQVIADPDPARLLAPRGEEIQETVARVLAGEEGAGVAEDSQGEAWLHAFAPIPSAGWGVIVERSAKAAFASASAFHIGLLAAIGVFLAGGLLFWLTLRAGDRTAGAADSFQPLRRPASRIAAPGARAVGGVDRTRRPDRPSWPQPGAHGSRDRRTAAGTGHAARHLPSGDIDARLLGGPRPDSRADQPPDRGGDMRHRRPRPQVEHFPGARQPRALRRLHGAPAH
jgi:hypothetical protein